MRALVYCHRTHTDVAEDRYGDDYRLLFRNAQAHVEGQLERGADLVIVEDTYPHIAEEYAAKGYETQLFNGSNRPAVDEDVELPEAEDVPEPTELPEGYTVERNGPWHTLYRDGQKVGKSHREREDAVEAAWADYQE